MARSLPRARAPSMEDRAAAPMSNDRSLPPFTDLHNHLVPAVDDGSGSVAESLASLQSLFDEGVRTLVSTPHLLLPRLDTDADIDRELEYHRRSFDTLVGAVAGRMDLPAIGLGQEIWAPDAASMRRIAWREDVGLGAGETLLVEFGFELRGTHRDVVEAATAAGRRVVIAHPERYQFPQGLDALDVMRGWRDLGAVLQVNAGSFGGYYNGQQPESERLAWAMVAEGLVDLVATDHHGSRRRGVSPLEVWDALVGRGMGELARRAMAVRPLEALGEGVVLAGPELRTPGADG